MKWLKAKQATHDFHDGKTEFFNLDKILNITPNPEQNRAKILMGGGLYWSVYLDSIVIMDLRNADFLDALKGDESL